MRSVPSVTRKARYINVRYIEVYLYYQGITVIGSKHLKIILFNFENKSTGTAPFDDPTVAQNEVRLVGNISPIK